MRQSEQVRHNWRAITRALAGKTENRKTLHRLGAAGTSSVAHMRAVLLAAVVLLGHSGAGADRDLVSPFDLQHVELHPDSDFYKQAALNEEFMLSISNDEVSHMGRADCLPGAGMQQWCCGCLASC